MTTGQREHYLINEIFYSIQGEGPDAGRPAVFIRFSKCNLVCAWCDTDFDAFEEMLAEDIVQEALNVLEGDPPSLAILTGGEPSLQADKELISRLQAQGFRVSMETNGVQWNTSILMVSPIVVSPKSQIHARNPSEAVKGWWIDPHLVAMCNLPTLKVVYDLKDPTLEETMARGVELPYTQRFLQPLMTPTEGGWIPNYDEVVAAVKRDPRWRLSMQLHKILGVR